MRKRLRKKHRVREYQELGFELAFRLPASLSDAQVMEFWDRFIDEVEARGLLCGGASGHEWDLFVTREGRESATDVDRDQLRRWLEADALVSEIRVSELVDASKCSRNSGLRYDA